MSEEPSLAERSAEIAERLVSYLGEHRWMPVEIVHDRYMLEVNPVVRTPDAAFVLSRQCGDGAWEPIAEGQTRDGMLVDLEGHRLALTPYTTALIDELLTATA
jgi:hypothetical protein